MRPFFISIPHAGERIPDEASWLKPLPETVLMCDVDRYVDQLYAPAIRSLGLPSVVTETHRYVVDLNRVPEDIDQDSVEGSKNPPGSFTHGYHWSKTMTEIILMKKPISQKLHEDWTIKFFTPFHAEIKKQFAQFKTAGFDKVYHLDAHSMPSKGTAGHRDPGQVRAQIVVSDQDGKSCDARYKDLVIESYQRVGFEVAYNWPYKGGRITETYGQPQLGQHTLQVEMNRALYMDEFSKQKTEDFELTQKKIVQALSFIYEGLGGL